MAARHAEMFTVWSASDLNELLTLLGESDGEPESMVVEIPDGATALQTGREFRRVIAAARSAGIAVEFATDDPLRRELASIMGARMNVESPSAVLTRAFAPDDATNRIERQTMAPGRAQTPFRPWQPRSEGHASWEDESLSVADASDPSFSFVVTPPPARRNPAPAERVIDPTRDIPPFELWESRSFPVQQLATPRRSHKGGIARLILTLVTLVAVASLLLALFIPTATVALTPMVAPIAADLTYGVAMPGKTYDITIQPELIASTLTFSSTLATTGERFVPDATAQGMVQLTNASTSAIVVELGTLFVSDIGVAYASTEAVTVPAADPFGTRTFGTVEVPVAATVAGPDGNAGADAIWGQFDSGIFYTNLGDITGGTVKRIATVSPADIDALASRATTDLQSQAAVAIGARLAPGQQLVAGSEQRDAPVLKLSHAVGADAESLKIDGSLRVTAQAYSLADIHDRARAEVEQRLTAQAGSDVTLVAGSLEISDAQEVAGSNGTAFAVHAAARTVAVISQTDLDALAADLPGMDHDAAVARIRQVHGIDGVSVSVTNNWIGDSLPRLGSRITIEVTGAQGVQTEAAQTRP